MRTFTFIIASLAICAAVPLSAQDVETISGQKPNRKMHPALSGTVAVMKPAGLWLASLDSDNDYRITHAEFAEGQVAAFGALDTKKTGSVRLLELEGWRERALGSVGAPPQVLQFDDNYDGRITRKEFSSTMEVQFRSHDANEDGVITFDELVQIIHLPPARRRAEKEKPKRDMGMNDRPRQRRR